MKVAALDVDGTLLEGALGIALLEAMVQRSVCRSTVLDEVAQTLRAHLQGDISYLELCDRAYRVYAHGLIGIRECIVRELAREVWQRAKAQLFPFVRSFLRVLREKDFQVAIISGSPHEIVAEAAHDLRVEHFQGAVFRSIDGVYDGTADLCPGEQGIKSRILMKLFGEHRLNLEASLAMGNGANDICLLQMVGTPLAFEPDRIMKPTAMARGWPMLGREDVLGFVAALS
jgi:HAD superfamily phosphoserine phosphatase-like hydrolase